MGLVGGRRLFLRPPKNAVVSRGGGGLQNPRQTGTSVADVGTRWRFCVDLGAPCWVGQSCQVAKVFKSALEQIDWLKSWCLNAWIVFIQLIHLMVLYPEF
jgi:hypothetical protein